MKKLTTHTENQDGFAAIIVTLIIMAVLVLITIGFFAVINREQRASLDRQLSTQAFYAAETGVNEAAIAISEDPNFQSITTCDEFEASSLAANSNVSDDGVVEYTCILIEVKPESLEFGAVETEQPTVVLVNAVDDDDNPIALDALNISWQSESPSVDSVSFPGGSSLDFPDAWPYDAPVLRTTITETDNLDRDSLVAGTFTTFLRPRQSGSANRNFDISSPTVQGQVTPASCDESNTPRYCNIRITNLNSSSYLLTLRAIYHNADVYITGEAAGSTIRFADQQAIVDATGRSNDVLRRLQVRVPIENQYARPGFGMETSRGGGICKQLSLYPGFGRDDSPDPNCAL